MPDRNADLKLIKAAELFSLAGDILEQDGRVWITVTGMSMYPFLRGDRDSVELSKAEFPNIKKGDIVLIRRLNHVYVLHRVLRIQENSFL
jgi:hypothetical protein